MALAATLLVVAGVRLYMTTADMESGPRLRGGAGLAAYPVQWSDGNARLAWKPAAGAASYRLELLDAGRAVLDTTIRDTSFVVPSSLASASPSIVWTVSAMLDDGSTVASQPIPLTQPRR
jgi:hypothetical protein